MAKFLLILKVTALIENAGGGLQFPASEPISQR
jgi:hypothetical protein